MDERLRFGDIVEWRNGGGIARWLIIGRPDHWPEPYQVECTDSAHATASIVRAVLAADNESEVPEHG